MEENGPFQINQYAVTRKDQILYLELDSRIELTDCELRRLIKGLDTLREKIKTYKLYARRINITNSVIKVEMTEGGKDCSIFHEMYYEEDYQNFRD